MWDYGGKGQFKNIVYIRVLNVASISSAFSYFLRLIRLFFVIYGKK